MAGGGIACEASTRLVSSAGGLGERGKSLGGIDRIFAGPLGVVGREGSFSCDTSFGKGSVFEEVTAEFEA